VLVVLDLDLAGRDEWPANSAIALGALTGNVIATMVRNIPAQARGVMVVPFWIVLWWIPRCDAVGIQKVKRMPHTNLQNTVSTTASQVSPPMSQG
jgi:hypothetical protein